MSAMEQYFSVRENCFKDMKKAREVAGNVNTTEEEFDGIERALGFMYVYCPTDLCISVLSVLEDLGRRRRYFERLWEKS